MPLQISMMPATALESTVAVHGKQLEEQEKRQDRVESSVRDVRDDIASLRNWIMSAVLASFLGLVGVVIQLLKK